MSNTTGSVPVVAEDRDHTCSRNGASAAATACRSAGVISAKVRATVVSEGTAPNRFGPARRCSMSKHDSPPPASINDACTSTLPRSCTGNSTPRDPDTEPRPTARRPPRAGQRTRPAHAGRHGPRPPCRQVPPSRAACCYRSPRKCPSCAGPAGLENQHCPTSEGLFRGRGPNRSISPVKYQGQSCRWTRSELVRRKFGAGVHRSARLGIDGFEAACRRQHKPGAFTRFCQRRAVIGA